MNLPKALPICDAFRISKMQHCLRQQWEALPHCQPPASLTKVLCEICLSYCTQAAVETPCNPATFWISRSTSCPSVISKFPCSVSLQQHDPVTWPTVVVLLVWHLVSRTETVQPKLQHLLLGISKQIFPKPILYVILGGVFSCVALKQAVCSESYLTSYLYMRFLFDSARAAFCCLWNSEWHTG